MRRVEPKVFLIAETRLVLGESLRDFFKEVGVPDWLENKVINDGVVSQPERLLEIMGRLCYRSWEPGLNPNVTKVREINKDYVENIIKVKHGSVLEHASVSFIFMNVSRVFTHELVRHRPGVAISQESLRFVRLTDLNLWLPTDVAGTDQEEEFERVFRLLEQAQKHLATAFEIDKLKPCPQCEGSGQSHYADMEASRRSEDMVMVPCPKCAGTGAVSAVPFSEKKKLTSAFRRIAPIGLATNIGWTANFRTLRWCLEARTHPSAEEEIRLVFGKVGEILTQRYPHAFGDFRKEVDENGLIQWTTVNNKV